MTFSISEVRKICPMISQGNTPINAIKVKMMLSTS